MKHLFIVGLPRSGGSLLARLFDGHPTVISYPFEPHFGEGDDLAPLSCSGSLAENLRRVGRYQRIRDIARRKRKTKAPWLSIDHKKFLAVLDARTASSTEEYLSGLAEAFSISCPQVASSEKTGVVVGHQAMAHLGNIEELLANNKGIYVLHVIRHPFDSIKSLSAFRSMDVRRECGLFAHSVASALSRARRYKGRYFTIRYEDFLSDVRSQLGDLCEALGIQWDDCLSHPTAVGRDWISNSSFEKGSGLRPPRQTAYDEKVASALGPYRFAMDAAGYTAAPPYIGRLSECVDDSLDKLCEILAPGCIDYLRLVAPEEVSSIDLAKLIASRVLSRTGLRVVSPVACCRRFDFGQSC